MLLTANSMQFESSGTFNGANASFRVCVQDNGEGKKAEADRFHLVCTAGCAYAAGGGIGGGNIDVRQRSRTKQYQGVKHDYESKKNSASCRRRCWFGYDRCRLGFP
jgi:hypothetical protein